MGIKTVPQPSYSPDLASYDFWLFPKLWGCRYETIEEMKEAVTKVIDTLTQEDVHGAFQKLLERYNNCIAAGGDYFELLKLASMPHNRWAEFKWWTRLFAFQFALILLPSPYGFR